MKFKVLKNWVKARTIINYIAFIFIVCVGVVFVDFAQVAKQTLKKIAIEMTFMGPEQFQYLGEYEATAYSDRFRETIGRPPIVITEQTGKGVKKTILKELSDDRLCTASGLPVDEETIAASRDYLDSGEFYFGEKLWIPQLHKSFVVKDKMGPDIKKRLDVFSFNRKYVDNFGVKTLKVYRIR